MASFCKVLLQKNFLRLTINHPPPHHPLGTILLRYGHTARHDLEKPPIHTNPPQNNSIGPASIGTDQIRNSSSGPSGEAAAADTAGSLRQEPTDAASSSNTSTAAPAN